MNVDVIVEGGGGEEMHGLEDIDVDDLRDSGNVETVNDEVDEQNDWNALFDEDFSVSLSVGKVYNSWEAIEVVYKTYAMSVGFGVARCQSAYCLDKKTKRAMTWKCERWGDPEGKVNAVPQNVDVGEVSKGLCKGKVKTRKSKKCMCCAMLYCARNEDDHWVIKKIELSHSGHSPTPADSNMVKEYRMRFFTNCMRNRVINDVDEGVSVAKIHGCMARERDGLDNCPFTEKDVRHIVDSRRRMKMQGGDTNALLKYLKNMQKQNVNFYNSFRTDANGVLKDIFWVDGRSRVAYEYFGDVICFDTTYLTNKYHLPFANFVGVNHHGQSVLLGCALLSHEDSETFEWVLSEWVEAMGGKPPGGILTDQAPAMRDPIAAVLPRTRHRWCLWHILRKFPHKFSTHKRYDAFKEALMQVVYDTFTSEEFCIRWEAVLLEFKAQDNDWLCGLFEDRQMWAPVYLKEYFWAGMRTTQRVESINSFFDKFVTRQTRLCDFGERYTAAVARRVKQEKDADALDSKHVRSRITGIGIEKFYRSIYTDAKYRAIQRECDRLTYVVYQHKHLVSDSVWEYELEDRIWRTCKGGVQHFLTEGLRKYNLIYNSVTQDIQCNCYKFETEGILCRHAIRVLDMNRIYKPPPQYILDRWRKDLVRRHSEIKVTYLEPNATSDIFRLDDLNLSFQRVATEAYVSSDTVDIVKKGLDSILKEVRTATRNTPLESPEGVVGENESWALEYNVLDPPIPKKKRGRPKGRMNSTVEQQKQSQKRKKKEKQKVKNNKNQKQSKVVKTSKNNKGSQNSKVRTPSTLSTTPTSLKVKRRPKRKRLAALCDEETT